MSEALRLLKQVYSEETMLLSRIVSFARDLKKEAKEKKVGKMIP